MTASSSKQAVTPQPFITAVSRWICLLGCGVNAICFGQAPVNDHFTNAIPLYGNDVTFTGTLSNATYETDEPGCIWGSCYDGPGNGSVWWSWTATNTTVAIVEVVACNPTLHAAITAHDAGHLSEITAFSSYDIAYLDGITNRYIFIANLEVTAGTTYRIRALGGGTGGFTLRLRAGTPLPILTPPRSQTVAAGGSAVFDFVYTWQPQMQFQWQFAGNDLIGQTNRVLFLSHIQANQAGEYAVVVNGTYGAITSAVATLTVSPSDSRPTLAAFNLPATNKFHFLLTGAAGRTYQILTSTNLLNWSPSAAYSGDDGVGVVLNSASTSMFAVPKDGEKTFVRAKPVLNAEACIANLKVIESTIQWWALMQKKPVGTPMQEWEIEYFWPLSGLPVCPSGGTAFSNSYSGFVVGAHPTCLIHPGTHHLPQ